jgi:hypothetical protein
VRREAPAAASHDNVALRNLTGSPSGCACGGGCPRCEAQSAQRSAPQVVQRRAGSAVIMRETEPYETSKARVLEELNRNMPVAILTMLDTMDGSTRTQLQADTEVTAAIAKLPRGAQDIVKRHLSRAAPQGPAGAQKRPAEQIPVTVSPGYADFGLNPDRPSQALAIFGQTDLANRLMDWFAANKLKVNVVFVGRRSELPGGKGEGAAADGTFEGTTAYVVGSNVAIDANGVPTDQASDRSAEALAKTVFHELLHIWFVNLNKLPKNDPFRTGHTAEVKAPTIGAAGGIYYDEANYAAQFLAGLKAFDAEVAAKKKAAAASP